MVIYSIKEIERLSGVKAHTLRIWEKRYGIVTPHRTETNIRYYTDEHLKKILNISFLNRNKIKISKIAELTDEEIKRRVSELSDVDKEFEDHLDTLVLSLLELDGYNFNKILDQHINQIGFEKTMNEIVYPLMDKLSVMWVAGSLKSVHESFVTNAVRSKIISATESISESKYDHIAKVIIYLPQDEDHELSLLYLNFLMKKYKYNVINLGTNVSLIEVFEAYQISKAEFIFTIINDSMSGNMLIDYVDELLKLKGKSTLLLTGRQVTLHQFQSSKGFEVFNSLKETISYLENKIPTHENA